MDTYCTLFRELSLWVGYTPSRRLEREACRYLFYLLGRRYSQGHLKGAVSAFRALEEMGWVPSFVTTHTWRCANWSSSP